VLANFLESGFNHTAGIKDKNAGSRPWEKLEVRSGLVDGGMCTSIPASTYGKTTEESAPSLSER